MAKKNEIIVNAALKYKDDGAIHIFSHGAPDGLSVLIRESKEYVRTADELEALLSQYSEIWQKKAEMDNITIVFRNGKAIATYKGSWKPKERPNFFEKIIYKE